MNNNNNSSNNLVNKALNDNKVSTGNVNVYYSSTVERHKASKVLNYFSHFKNGDFHIEKANRYYTVKMVCKEGLWLDQDIINQAKEILQELKRDVFCTDSVDFHLCNDELETKRVII